MSDLVLRPGKEISTSAHVRIRRATALYQEIERELAEWREREPLRIQRVLNRTANQLSIFATISESPDLDEIGATYDDLVHNLWAAHDNLFHDLLKLPGVTAPKRNHYFPARTTQESWQTFADEYRTLPPVILERIRRLQPFVDHRIDGTSDEDYVKSSAMFMVRGENTEYKHKTAASCSILRHEFYAGPIRFKGDPVFWEAPPDSDPFADEPFRTVTMPPGSEILSYPLGVGVQVCVHNPVSNELQPLLQSAAVALTQADFNVKAVCMGLESARDLAGTVGGLGAVWYDLSVLSLDDPEERDWQVVG